MSRRASTTPPPLPPETRTVGQLVAETIRLYGRRFWRSLALGLPPAVLTIVAGGMERSAWLVLMATAGGLVLTASYVAATALAADVRLDVRRSLLAVAAGAVIWGVVGAFFAVPFAAVAYKAGSYLRTNARAAPLP